MQKIFRKTFYLQIPAKIMDFWNFFTGQCRILEYLVDEVKNSNDMVIEASSKFIEMLI